MKSFFVPFLFHLTFALLSCFSIIFIAVLSLFFYTNRGESSSIEVPNLLGLSISSLLKKRQASFEHPEKIKSLPFHFKVLDSVYLSDKNPGEIIRQYPSATYIDPVDQILKKRWIKEQKEIGLVINRFKPPMVNMFNYYARPAREVRISLRELGIEIAKEIKINADICPACVVKISNMQGVTIYHQDQVRLGEQVTIYLDAMGIKESKMVNLPLLEGMTIEQAQETIRQAKLNLGNITSDQEDYSEQSIITTQSPNPKKRPQVSIGTYVNIGVSN